MTGRLARRVAVSAALVLFLPLPTIARAQQGTATSTKSSNGKKVLTLADYGRWNRIQAGGLSSDGRWFAYAQTPNEGDGTLYIKDLDGSMVHTVPRGSGPIFSDDARWIAYIVSPPTPTGRGGRAGGGARGGQAGATPAAAPVRALMLKNLVTGTTDSIPDVGTFRFVKGSGFLVMKRNQPASQTTFEGTDLVLRNLRDGTSLNLGNVDEYAFNDAATHVAYVIDANGRAGNGLSLLDLTKGTITPLSSSALEYNQLSWNRAGNALAVLKGEKPKGMMQRQNALVVATAVGTLKQAIVELDPGKDKVLPEGFVISELSAASFTRDGSRIQLGIKEQEAEPPQSSEPVANVDVWHWKDEEVQSVQQVRADQNRRFTYAATFDIATKTFRRVADEEMRQVTFTNDNRFGIGRIDKPYWYDVEWGASKADHYRVDLNTGERKLIAKGLSRTMGVSPDGKWYLFLQDKQVIAHNIATGSTVNVTQISGVDFVDHSDDHPYELPIYGVAGWTKDNKSVILNHDHDIWQVPLEGGKAVNLTGGVGAAEQIRFRIVRFDAAGGGGGRGGRGGGGGGGGDQDGIDLTKPITLSAMGDRTKKSGYYELKPGGNPTPIVFADASIGGVSKAEKTDRIVFTTQTFVDFPNYFVSNTRFESPKQITDANPQQAEYAWSPGRVLIDYTDARGNKLQGTLALPANYEPGKKYPMLVYFYELMSDQHFRYQAPSFDDRPHAATYTSDGYLYFQPDVVYTIGKPGTSAVDDVTSAVKKVIELGYADPARIGLQGHSWGGYQSSYILTQTNMFAAVVTGAPVTNLVSFYNELYKSSGTVQQGIMEVGQVRMGKGNTPWSAHELYESQSPVHQAEKIKTPFLILHGTADGAVDWHQGLEYYNTARRLGKEVILLSYPDEPHHLAKKENQKDFQIRMKQYFDHYLKTTPAPKWMTDGVPFLRKAIERPEAPVPVKTSGN
ncbi:MAG: prolyl oligopeptidase family serine peptidase [Gemmatimonadota bacterium]